MNLAKISTETIFTLTFISRCGAVLFRSIQAAVLTRFEFLTLVSGPTILTLPFAVFIANSIFVGFTWNALFLTWNSGRRKFCRCSCSSCRWSCRWSCCWSCCWSCRCHHPLDTNIIVVFVVHFVFADFVVFTICMCTTFATVFRFELF